jgi:hypothetical protein
MISLLVFLTGMLMAIFVAVKTRGNMYVQGENRYGNMTRKFQPSWLIKPIAIFFVGLLVSIFQPFSIEKIDAGHKGLKINLIGVLSLKKNFYFLLSFLIWLLDFLL